MCFGFHKEVYVIKGSDKNALLLGENISTHDASRKHSDVKRLVIFLIEEDDDEKKTYEKASHFGGIVKVLDRKNNFEFYMKKARLGKWSGRNKKYNVILMPNSTSISDDAHLVVEYAKGKNVKPERLDIFAFTLSEWERERIETTSQAKEGENRKYPYTFHIINEVDLLVRLMLENHPPYECVGLGLKNGVATRDFTVLIIGFGAVGQNALLRLIMNGQFVGSRMHAIIIDRDIEHLHEHFMHCHPSLNLCCDMDFRSINVRDEVFFKLLRENHEVDYIVAAINDDELNKQTAMDIRLHYERNNIALPFIAVLEGNRCLHEVKQDREIFVCGHQEETYKESIIIREKTDLMAKTISDTYKEIYGGNSWYEHDWFSQESNRASADFIPAMLKLAQLKKDDVINKDVLTEDSELAEILAQTEHLRWMAFHAAMGYRPISIEEMRQRFKYNGNKNPLEYSRRCSEKRLHVCLASWDELDGISAAYRELERRAGKEPKRDFKENDRDIIKYIPKFIRAAKGGE
ncbi:MAG: NAD-binding protein [Treponema sp.]|nr:NAD-binding protein [Treponema sp.]